MKNENGASGVLLHVLTSGRLVLVTMALCCLLYPVAILVAGQVVTPRTANGSLIRDDFDEIVGSELIAQGFSRPEYFWPRPSAVDYNAAAAGGSNLSPLNPQLRSRALAIIGKIRTTGSSLAPADLVTASGSGLDPHISMSAARIQAERVASARGLSLAAVMDLLEMNAEDPGGPLTHGPLVNVLLVNLELDRIEKMRK